jgi:Methyltransferase domain
MELRQWAVSTEMRCVDNRTATARRVTQETAERLSYALRASHAIATQPREGVERVRERLAERHDLRRGPWQPVCMADERALHRRLGLPWPCAEHDAFVEVWAAALATLGHQGLNAGRGAFGGWDDGDARLCRMAWCLARHLRPRRALETGVGRGLTTRVLLEAFDRNGDGHLWSVDLPPLLERGLAAQCGAAVTPRLHDRWTLVAGSSRHVLPTLLPAIGRLDLFVHDSMHTTRNVTFELARVWPVLTSGGAVLVDDVERNHGLERFLVARPGLDAMVSSAEDGGALIGCVIKPDGHVTRHERRRAVR